MTLDDEVASFLMGGVSISVASRSSDMLPSVARCKGCIVKREPTTRLRILLSASQAGDILRDVEATHTISATFSMPTTHRTLQFKGTDARVTSLETDEAQAVVDYVKNFGTVLITGIGIQPEFVAAFLASPADEVAIEFTPTDSFLQTPGPRAGLRL
jgi:hypothetical protein